MAVAKMVELTFYGGANEIGGNKVLLEDKMTRIFLDFGESFTFGADYFAGWLLPRTVNGLRDYFDLNLMPKIEGLYAKKQLASTDLPHMEPKFDAVFLSHAHFDHLSHIRFLDPEIPVYLGKGTKLFLEAMEKTSSSTNFGAHEYRTFRTGDTLKVGNVIVEPVHVDHSIPAAYGFIIHTSKGTLVYTGDLRMHGPRSDLTADFLDKARNCEPNALISEGTRIVENRRRKNYSELQVERLGGKTVSSTDKIVFVARYSRDMDRFRSFYNLAKATGRKIVVFPKTAYLLNKLVDDKRLDLPNPLRDRNIVVYYKRKKSGRYEENDYYIWERTFMEKMVTHEFVRKNQSNLIMDLDFYQFAELIDIKPDSGSHFIHSTSEPFSEEDIEDRVMHNWLRHFQIHFHQLHASGHLNRRQIDRFIKHVKPKKIFPVHTENAEGFKELCDGVQMIEKGKKYSL